MNRVWSCLTVVLATVLSLVAVVRMRQNASGGELARTVTTGGHDSTLSRCRSPMTDETYPEAPESFLRLIRQSPLRWRLTDEQCEELTLGFRRVADAYVCGSTQALHAAMMHVPAFVTNASDHVFEKVSSPVRKALDQGFFRSRVDGPVVRPFDDVSAFEEFATLNVELVSFLGKIDLRRETYSYDLLAYDSFVLLRLTQYRDDFSRRGREDLKNCAVRFLREWQGHVESEECFTRNFMRVQKTVTYNWKDDVVRMKHIRSFSRKLIKNGYTPKWLDEEFPLPTEADSGRERAYEK